MVYFSKKVVTWLHHPQSLQPSGFQRSKSVTTDFSKKWLRIKEPFMKDESKVLESLEVLVLRYKTNKEKCSPEDLRGKYALAFRNLMQQIADAASHYVTEKIRGFTVQDDDEGRALAEKVKQMYRTEGYGQRISRALFQEYSVQELKAIAEEYRDKIKGIWEPYFNRFSEILATPGCFDHYNPSAPLIYNSLIERYYVSGRWIKRSDPEGVVISIRKEVGV